MTADRITVEPPPSERPLMIYDGDCSFCRRWIERWRLVTRDRIDYRTSQEVGRFYPEIPSEQFTSAVQLVDTSGEVSSGAEAVFAALSSRPQGGFWIRLYGKSKVFALLTERTYALVARNRGLFSLITRALWGKPVEPPTYVFSSWLFLRMLGAVALIAFLSYWTQAEGLVGGDGILPFSVDLQNVDRHWQENEMGFSKYWYRPSLLWLNPSDSAIHTLFLAGIAASLLLCLGVAPALSTFAVWAIYLSLMSVGGEFLTFQWDILLIETAFLGIFLAPAVWLDRLQVRPLPSHLARWLIWLLLFKLMFESGVVKLTYFGANDENTWRDLTALDFHYWSQPIPAWTSWYIHHLPGWMDRISLWFMFVVELILPFTIFSPRRVKVIGFLGLVLFQVLIIVSGNYGFFNILTILLCVSLVDDQSLPSFLQKNTAETDLRKPTPWIVRIPRLVVLLPFTALVLYLGSYYLRRDLQGNRPDAEKPLREPSETVMKLVRRIQPLHVVNSYGLFRVMTTTRPEIIIEGTADGVNWLPYIFKWKPVDPSERPKFVTPHMPRLDWQMWFAGLQVERGGTFRASRPWFSRFLQEIAKNNPTVLSLIRENPFPDEPPRLIRLRLFHYTFTDPKTRKDTGAWWNRTLLDQFTFQLKVN